MSKKRKTPNTIMYIDLNLMDGPPTYLYNIPVYSFEDDEVNKLLHNSNYIIVSRTSSLVRLSFVDKQNNIIHIPIHTHSVNGETTYSLPDRKILQYVRENGGPIDLFHIGKGTTIYPDISLTVARNIAHSISNPNNWPESKGPEFPLLDCPEYTELYFTIAPNGKYKKRSPPPTKTEVNAFFTNYLSKIKPLPPPSAYGGTQKSLRKTRRTNRSKKKRVLFF